MVAISSLEEGSIVEVRHRRFVIMSIRPTSLPLEPLQQPQHLVTLSSIEDEGFAEEIQVVWELEPGAHIAEHIVQPTVDGFDAPRRLDAFLDAVRWGTTTSADSSSILAPFRSGVEVEDYQLDPVARAIRMPRVSLLIADDVGLGKTIEAGLVCQELLLRHRARTILIVCPSSLQIQWQDQMRDKFGLEFRIVDSQLMRDLRRSRGLHVNPWTHFPRLITSIDFLKRERPFRLMSDVLPGDGQSTYPRKFDLMIIDEAHNIAPSGRGKYALDSQRTQAIRRLVPHFEHKLFLSATPHNGYQESFTALLELLDNQRFVRGVEPRQEQLRAVMVRRLKSELPPSWDNKPRFPQRQLYPLKVTYTEQEKRIHTALREYTKSRLDNAASDVERLATEFVMKLLKKRLFSSPFAFGLTLSRHRESLTSTKRRESVRIPTVSILRQQINQIDDEFGDEEAFDEVTMDTLDESTRLFREPSPQELDLLNEMQAWAEQGYMHPDSKTRQLLDWLRQELCPDGVWNEHRVIIFTEYRDTQKWLYDMLADERFTKGRRIMTLYGGMSTEDRERIKAAFQSLPSLDNVRILLATDAASEGIDLQNYCSRLIHFEIPWNPNRMEQRNGRIDRHGQNASEIQIFHFVGANYQEHQPASQETPRFDLEDDLEFLLRAALKVNQIREDLGSVGPVIAQQVEEAMLGRRRKLDVQALDNTGQSTRNLLKFEKDLKKLVENLRNEYQDTRLKLRLEPDNIAMVVQIALEMADQPPLISVSIPPGPGQTEAIAAFKLPAFKGSWSQCSDGLQHPYTKEIRPITFDESVVHGRDDVVLAHLNHRLVQMSLRLLRSEIWSASSQSHLHRVTARLVPHVQLHDPAIISFARLLVLGGDQSRLHEEVIAAGVFLREGKVVRMNVGEAEKLINAATDQPAQPSMQQRLAELWPQHRQPMENALNARANTRFDSLQNLLQDRERREIDQITDIMKELQAAILRELTGPSGIVQMQLDFSPEEKDQVQRNRDFLQQRANEIPAELEKEIQAVHRRFANMQHRIFPLAIMYLVPDRMA